MKIKNRKTLKKIKNKTITPAIYEQLEFNFMKGIKDTFKIQLSNEKSIHYTEFDMDMSNQTYAFLLQHAKTNIMNDEKTLINWAVVDLLSKHLDEKA